MAKRTWSKRDNETPEPEEIPAEELVIEETDAEAAEGAEPDASNAGEGEEAEDSETAWSKKLAKAVQERDELNDQLLRTIAEYENFKRRSKREKDQLYTDSVSDVLKEWLPVIDNLERALEACEQTESEEGASLAEGIRLIYRQVGDTLAKLGVEVIEAEGQPFDPVYHNAVAQVASDEHEEGTVVDVLAKGYKRGEWVIRHSIVRVAS